MLGTTKAVPSSMVLILRHAHSRTCRAHINRFPPQSTMRAELGLLAERSIAGAGPIGTFPSLARDIRK